MKEMTLFDQPVTDLDRYHNTNDICGGVLRIREIKNGSQNKKILDFFKAHSYENFTPWEVQKALGISSMPITSVRRSMSDLTFMEYLEKTKIKRPGQYGEPCFAWKLR